MEERNITAFQGDRLIATGSISNVLPLVKEVTDRDEAETMLIFDDLTGAQIDFDLHGTIDKVLAKAANHNLFTTGIQPVLQKAAPGRPKLGVTAREVTLLPRHWSWLETQPNGVSAALRRLIEETMKRSPEVEKIRLARDAAAKVMWVLGGNLPDFEEASRLLYRGDIEGFTSLIRRWPPDIQHYLLRIANP